MDWFSKFLGNFQRPSSYNDSYEDHHGGKYFDDSPNSNGPTPNQSRSPRESLLKDSDKSKSGESFNPPHRYKEYHIPFSPQDDRNFDFFEGNENVYEDVFSFSLSFADPFRMMEDFMKSFEGFSLQPFSGFHSGPHQGFLEDSPKIYHDENKGDKDIDDSASNAASLLKEGPGFSYGGDQQNSLNITEPQPSFKHNFRSTSIIRVRKPDGTIEERRKYTDSSGREEETITTSEPTSDESPSISQFGNNGNLFPEDGSPFPKGGIFSWIFPRW